MPQVSIVVPTYNRARYVIQAIDSVLAQTFRDYEIIVVDDGSTDNTKEILQSYNDKIRYIYQTNKGVSAARNTGICVAKGEWIAFLDSDDIWLPDKLEKQMKNADSEDVIYSHLTKWFVDNENDAILLKKCESIHWPKTDREGYVFDPILSVAGADSYMTPTFLCHRSCFDRIGYFEEYLTAGEDEDWLSRASLFCKFHILSEALAHIRYHPNQTGLDSEKSVRSLIKVFDRMCERLKDVHPTAYRAAKIRWASKMSHLSNILAQNAENMQAFHCTWKAFLVEPYKIGRLIKGILFVIGWRR